jgi:IS5 family transposase
LLNSLTKQKILASYPRVKEKMNYLKEAIEDTRDHYILSNDPDARIGHKTTNTSFFGYKTHLAMTEERIITGAVVTSGEKDDGKQLSELLDQSLNNGVPVDTIIADKAYSCKRNLHIASKNKIRLVSKLHPNLLGTHKKDDGFSFNKDAGMYVCPAGHISIRRAKHGKKIKSSNPYDAYYFDVDTCKVCQLKEGCYKEGAKTKSYNISIQTPEQQEQMIFQESDYFKRKAKERYKIEAKNAGLKNRYGYDKAESLGIIRMQMQGAMTIFAANVKRILKLING